MHARTSFLLALPLLAAACQDAELCEDGTIERDGQCVPAAMQVRLTHFDVKYDLSQPVFINNRVPITFGLTADSVDPTTTRDVAVTISFVEANPSDPKNPLACSSSAIYVELTGDGSEQLVDGFIWPTSLCSALAAKNTEVNLQVDFNGGAEAAAELDSDVDAPTVVLTEANRGDARNQLCRDADAKVGCVNVIDLQPTPAGASGPLIDVLYGLSADSSVAVVPFKPVDDLGTADLQPSLVVQSRLVVNGRDPYISAVDPALIPASLIEAVPTIKEDLKFGLNEAALAALSALPGKAVVSYTLRAASDTTTELPLTVRDPKDATQRVAEVSVDEVLPGTANDVVHELFIEGATLDAVSPGGAWDGESDFVVRGCFAASFPQDGNKGAGQVDDCRDIEVMLVHETATASGASSRSFDKEFVRKLGSDRIRIESSMSTQNHIDLNGAASQIEGKVVLAGKIGKSFSLTMARAFATASLNVDPNKTAYEVGVDAFGSSIYSVSKQLSPIVQSDEFSAAKSFTIGNLGFGFGPVSIGIKIGVGGKIGIETEDTLEVLVDNATCQDLLKATDDITACGRLTRVTTPNFGLTGNVEGGINIKIAKAAVVADLSFVTTRFPLDTTLGWGLTADNVLLARGDATWDMSFQPLAGKVSIVGKIGVGWFSKKLKVNLFSFSSPTFKTRLMSLSMAASEALQ